MGEFGIVSVLGVVMTAGGGWLRLERWEAVEGHFGWRDEIDRCVRIVGNGRVLEFTVEVCCGLGGGKGDEGYLVPG